MDAIRRAGVCALGLLPSAGQADLGAELDEARLGRYADTSLRVFDPYESAAVEDFGEFLASTPMTNSRPVPDQLIRDTRAAFEFLRAGLGRSAPAYFVASYVDKTVLMPLSPTAKRRLRDRYGEDLLPQTACPIFATHADADVPSMLSTASGLPEHFFINAPGARDNYHRLFLLTEASHCGFLARLGDEPDLHGAFRSTNDFRAVLEAIGDFEAIAAFRQLRVPASRGDEGDVLAAVRVLAMFLGNRPTAYTLIPGLVEAYERQGIRAGSSNIAEVEATVASARSRFRELTRGLGGASPRSSDGDLEAMAERIEAALADGSGGSADEDLLRKFPQAVRIVSGDDSLALADWGREPLLTLPGVTPPVSLSVAD